ncbi:MAG: zinc ribbon domain-containing protein [Candidatus Thorarchaeota archaeon]|nr:MAG: zinc ribbon domain-containing protein [Candidatus Thorarchaeota archaeon]
MRCSGCGKELNPKTKSCPNCGRLVTASIRDRLYSKSSESYSGVLHQQGRVMVDQDYSEEVKKATERREMTKDSQVAQPTDGHKPLRIVDGSAVIASNRITFSVTSGIVPVGDFALSFDEPEKGISATATNPDFKISTDNRKYIVYLEVWERDVSSIEDSDLIVTDIEGSDTSMQYNVGFRWLPATGKTMTNADLVDILESQKKDHKLRHLVPLAVLEVQKKGPIKVTHHASESVDVLKPRSTISVKALGSKMDGSYYVAATRHKISTSDESESSQRIQCGFCGTTNDKSDKFCRNCGGRLTS